jgi:hypothetical protein
MPRRYHVVGTVKKRITGYSVKCIPLRHIDLGRGNVLTKGPMIGASVTIEVDGKTQTVPSYPNEKPLINQEPTAEMVEEVCADLMRTRPLHTEWEFNKCKGKDGTFYKFAERN